MRRMLVIALVVVLTGCSAFDDSSVSTATTTTTSMLVAPRIVAASCPSSIAAVPNVRCRWLVVPEDRTAPTNRSIHLFVTMLSSRTAVTREPVLVLQGGPGDTPDLASFVDHPLRDGHAVIILDQRGTGRSRPSLACPELSSAYYVTLGEDPRVPTTANQIVAAARACHQRLTGDGVNLRAYNTAENAADVIDLRRALHVRTWDLAGNSYGSRLALTVLRRDARGVHAVGLSGTYPPDVNAFTGIAGATADAFDGLFAARPGLRAKFVALVRRLERDPVRATADTSTGRRVAVLFDGDNLVGFVRQALYDTRLIPSVPALIEHLAEGTGFDAVTALVAQQAPTLIDATHESFGMFFSVQCQEDLPRMDLARVRAAVKRYPSLDSVTALVYPYARICALWNVGVQPRATRRAVHSAVPVAMFSGALDPATPPAWARRAARTLTNGHVFILPGYGHDTTALPCPRAARNRFFADPSRAPDEACLSSPQ